MLCKETLGKKKCIKKSSFFRKGLEAILWLSAFGSSNLPPCNENLFDGWTGRIGKMKREMNAKARGLSVDLEKLGKAQKKNAWLGLAYRVSRPVRQKAEVNLFELSKAAKRNSGKMLVVAGKVLATGDASGKIEVACIACSATARQKITKAGGEVLSIKEFISSKPAANKMVIIE